MNLIKKEAKIQISGKNLLILDYKIQEEKKKRLCHLMHQQTQL